MPATRRAITRDDAERLVAERGFGRTPDAPPPGRHVGIELEWLAVRADDPRRPADLTTTRAAAEAAGPLPCGSRLTFEPGGQVELSSPPLPLSEVCAVVAHDAAVLGDALHRADVGLVAIGLEPGPRRERLVRSSRYDAMEAYFDTLGTDGRAMMRSTAAVQVNLDLGDAVDAPARCRAAHDVGPVLAATFANSPFGEHGPTGYRSTRLDVWANLDRSRTTAIDARSDDHRRAWVEYALAAPVMLVEAGGGRYEAQLERLTFCEWIERGHALGWPTVDDLEYHLTTLFPPVRPRGWLELRMIDALPSPWWRVATAVSAVLVHDERLADVVARDARPTRDAWSAAARDGLRSPVLAGAAFACFEAALGSLPAAGADATTITAAEDYFERYVARGRCPADDLLDEWNAHGSMLPVPDNAREGAWS